MTPELMVYSRSPAKVPYLLSEIGHAFLWTQSNQPTKIRCGLHMGYEYVFGAAGKSLTNMSIDIDAWCAVVAIQPTYHKEGSVLLKNATWI